ncbi:MAG: hypothetical protein ACTS2F_14715 [Thainema sp.]
MHNKIIILKRKQKRAYIYHINRWLMHAIDAVVKFLIRPHNEPIIHQRETAYGSQWYVYNPRTQTKQVFFSKQEVIDWIERCYYN